MSSNKEIRNQPDYLVVVVFCFVSLPNLYKYFVSNYPSGFLEKIEVCSFDKIQQIFQSANHWVTVYKIMSFIDNVS